MKRLVSFLHRKSGPAAIILRDRIDQKISRLEMSPNLGSPYGDFKRIFVKLSRASMYEIVYYFDEPQDTILIMSMRHAKEDSGYFAHDLTDSEESDSADKD